MYHSTALAGSTELGTPLNSVATAVAHYTSSFTWQFSILSSGTAFLAAWHLFQVGGCLPTRILVNEKEQGTPFASTHVNLA